MGYTRKSDTPMTVAVVEAVSSFADREPTELPPLYEAIDTDALDALFEPRTGASDRSCRVSFVFDEFRVTIENSERIVVESGTTPAVNGS